MNTKSMFLLFVAMVVLTTQSTARVIPTRSLVDTNDNVAVQEEDLQKLYDNLMTYLNMKPSRVMGELVPVFVDAMSPTNAPEPASVPQPSHNHKHKHKHEEHHHKHGHEEDDHKHEHEHHHHKHEHKDHHHKHNPHHEPQTLPPSTPTSAPAISPDSYIRWM